MHWRERAFSAPTDSEIQNRFSAYILLYTRVRRQEIDNDYAKHSLISFLLFVTIPATCWAKGETKKIEISGDRLNATIEIFDPSVVTKISIWNGPMVRSCDSQGNCTAQTDPEKTHAFVDWPKGMVDDPSSNLERYVIAIHIAGREARSRMSERAYRFIYVMSPESGYVYLPYPGDKELGNNIILNDVEGNWFYSSARWETLIRPFMEKGAQ